MITMTRTRLQFNATELSTKKNYSAGRLADQSGSLRDAFSAFLEKLRAA
jgi:hypothetical protein